MIYLLTLILGISISYIASIPVGAVNMAVVQATLNDRKRTALFIGLGAIIIEALYCAIPLFGVKAMAKGTAVFDWMIIGSIPILITLGIVTILRRKKELKRRRAQAPNPSPFRAMLFGATLCVTNPMIILFWTQITFFLDMKGLLGSTAEELVFMLSVPLGTFLLYLTFIYISNRTKRFISMRSKIKVNVVVGIIFIGLGVYLGVTYFLGHKENLKPGKSKVIPPTSAQEAPAAVPFQM